MTELEKMRNGDYYSMEDAEIIAIHQRAANICQQFNALPVTESEERDKLLRRYLARQERTSASSRDSTATLAATFMWVTAS